MLKSPSEYHERLDRVSILERLDGSQELLAELIQLFLEEAPQLIQTMRGALQQGDMQVLARTAHSMKGAASNFLAYGTSSAALHLETDAKNGDLEAARASLAALENVVERLLPELANLCQGSLK
ncbi:MAG TPA: Hpt domain-containing protein [Bryobacteraceae bacterium]|nr:Hpt domain-containing protein [Bryobacteraceae bacterium]